MEPSEVIEPDPTPRLHDLSATFALIDQIEQLGAGSTQGDARADDDEARRLARGLERILAELELPPNVRLLRPRGGAPDV